MPVSTRGQTHTPGCLKVLHVTAPAPIGGLESVVTALARGHAAVGHEVHVVSVFDAGAVGRPLAGDAHGVCTHVVTIPRRRYWQERAAVAAIGRQIGVDVVHCHGYRPDVVDGPVARQLGVPLVTTVHGFAGPGPAGGLKGRLFEWLDVRALRRFDAVVAVSRPLVDRLTKSGVPAGRVHLIPNAWSPGALLAMDRTRARQRLGLPAEGLVIGWVGRLSREKGPDVLLEALEILGDDAPVAAFVGDGPEAARLRAAAAVGSRADVRWCGRVDSAAAVMPAFDLFVLSSRTEGTPIVLFEAMAAGVPLVATRVGGVPDVVSDSEALLVPADDPAGLAAALRTALGDLAEAAVRAAAARERLEREFAAGPWLARYERLYGNLIAARKPL